MSQEETQIDAEETRLYELAFHVIPTVNDSEAADVFNKIKDAVAKTGKVIAASEPTHIPLAYVMETSIEARKRKYNTAYFAWVKFEAEPAFIEPLQKDLDLNNNILRYMIIKSEKESTLSTQEVAQMLKGDEEEEAPSASAEATSDEKEAESVKVVETAPAAEEAKDSSEEIDKAIDDLVK